MFDADSHVMELPDWLATFADDATRDRLRPLALGGAGALADAAVAQADERRRSGRTAGAAGMDGASLLQTKGWSAVGAFDAAERSTVLDALGFSAQLVFPTFAPTQFAVAGDLDLVYGGTDALNRAMAAFCGADSRLLAVGSVPWGDPARTIESARRALAEGCNAIQVPTDLPAASSPRPIRTTMPCGRCWRKRTSRSSATSVVAAARCAPASTTTVVR